MHWALFFLALSFERLGPGGAAVSTASAAETAYRRSKPASSLSDDDVSLLQVSGHERREKADVEGCPSFKQNGRMLLFWAVGSLPRAISLVRKNIDSLRSQVASMHNIHMDVLLVHYDMNQTASWMSTAADREWYAKNVQFSFGMPGYKMRLARDILWANRSLGESRNQSLVQNQTAPDVDTYEWLWLLDEDVDFSNGTTLKHVLQEARSTGAHIVGPSVFVPWSPVSMLREEGMTNAVEKRAACQPGSPLCQLAARDSRCRYRYVNFVEIMFTLIRPHAFKAVLEGCPDCLHPSNAWGLDRTWCSLVPRRLNCSKLKFCAILDRVEVIHENLKTLNKWQGPSSRMTRTGNLDILMVNHKDMHNVQRHHELDYAVAVKQYECVE